MQNTRSAWGSVREIDDEEDGRYVGRRNRGSRIAGQGAEARQRDPQSRTGRIDIERSAPTAAIRTPDLDRRAKRPVPHQRQDDRIEILALNIRREGDELTVPCPRPKVVLER